MSRCGNKVHTEFLDVHRHVWYGLTGVEDDDTVGRGTFSDCGDNLFDGVYASQYVGYVLQTYDLGIGRNQFIQLCKIATVIVIVILSQVPTLTLCINWNILQRSTHLLTNHLPRNDIRMMFQFTNQHLIPMFQMDTPIRCRDEVECLCRSTCKYNFISGIGIDELRDTVAGGFVFGRGTLGECMCSTVDVGVDGVVVGGEFGNDRCGFLGCCRRVEVDEFLSFVISFIFSIVVFKVFRGGEDWKILSYSFGQFGIFQLE
mmetsp:Transcript_23423/g.28779  ORF Transcript_23423/g.28779 Transcript_23423/m.28779 type:complete len:259 (-) Transcript_23423:170-946(-)